MTTTNHSDKGLETLTQMKSVPTDWGLTEIKWEMRRVDEEVWVLCPLCAGAGEIGTVKGKTVPRHEAWNTGASATIRTCTECPKLHFTRAGREYFRQNEETGIWVNTRHIVNGAASSNQYSFANGLVSKVCTIEKLVGIVQWAKGTKFSSRFAYKFGATAGHRECHLCAKAIPSGRFIPVTAKIADGTILGMWVGEDCARKFFGIKNFKKDQTVLTGVA